MLHFTKKKKHGIFLKGSFVMGNANPTLGVKESGDYGSGMVKGQPIGFHRIHSENVSISVDGRRAKRIESFCKGICFSDRPINCSERVYVKFAEVSTSWSGVVRVGFTSHDPVTINPTELPRYACPDLTYKPGYWAKALPERYSEQGTVLFYYFTRNGDVMFGINGEEKGVFFNNVTTNSNLWALVDIYGNTTCMEFVDGWQLNNVGTNSVLGSGGSMTHQDMDTTFHQSLTLTQPSTPTLLGHQSSSLPALPITERTPPSTNTSILTMLTLLPVRYHLDEVFVPLPFHHTMGRNVVLSSDRSIAVRLVEEYCNGYVFTDRPILCGEKIVIQIITLEKEYTGGLAFGMSSCDPMTISPEDLPDDSDLLLDRPEYWVVNKDVCTTPEVGDELSFHLTEEGEVRYGKNGHYIATLMYIDKTLPMWAFFDIYGNTQKIHCLGVVSPGSEAGQGSGLMVALPPPRNPSISSLPTTSGTTTPPPRPPPPRASPSGGQSLTTQKVTPPSLPPKHFRQSSEPGATGQSSPVHPAILMQSPRTMGSPLPPPLLPTPLSQNSQNQQNQQNIRKASGKHPRSAPTLPQRQTLRMSASPVKPTQSSSARSPKAPMLAPSNLKSAPVSPSRPTDSSPGPVPPSPAISVAESYDEAMDNESNECKVCMNNAVDCVLYACGHMCLCYECALDIKTKHNLCPICRQDIKDIIRIYRS